jgi:hypothetical protein
MVKNIAIGSIAVFVLWAGLEWVIHGIFIKPIYMDTKHLWRPAADINMGLYFSLTLFSRRRIYGNLCEAHISKKIFVTRLSMALFLVLAWA